MKHKYKLCISVSGKTVSSLMSRMNLARRFRPDLIELRLDFIRELDIEKLDAIRAHLRGKEILTVRSKQEDGHLAITDGERVKLIQYVITHLKPSIVDIEISTIRKFPILIQDLKKSSSSLVASFHDLHGDKGEAYLRKMASLAPYKLKSSLYAVKIVSKAIKLGDNLKILNLYRSVDDSSKLVAFCIGRLGVPSRILSIYLGAPFGYASLPGEPVAPGQMDIESMRRLLKY